MKLLAIDTTETACSAALIIDGEVTGRLKIAPRQHSDLILPMMDELLIDAGLAPAQLDALAFARGPGSFTGVRIAAAVIQGVAFASDLPVVPVSSLRALAQGAWRCHGAAYVLAAFDARMEEVYFGQYRLGSNELMSLHGEEQVLNPADIDQPALYDWYGAGSGWQQYRQQLLPLGVAEGRVFSDLQVNAIDVAALGVADIDLAVAAENALPVYIRNQVAWKKPAH